MNKQHFLDVELFNYIQNTLNIPNELQHPQEHFMQITPYQALFLQFLIQSINAKNILELGTFYGYSAAAMAMAIPENGTITTCDHDSRIIDIAFSYWEKLNIKNKINFIQGNALEILKNLILENKKFDFIFIDADKKPYIQYYEHAKKLISPHGMIAIDNTLYHGEVILETPSKAGKAIQDFNLHVKKDQEVLSYILPIGDGITIVKVKATSAIPDYQNNM